MPLGVEGGDAVANSPAGVCQNCGKYLSPGWRDRCKHCGAPMSVARPRHSLVQSVFRGLTRDDAMKQAQIDAVNARANGYEPASQEWTEDAGIHVLTVAYRDTGRMPDFASPPRHWLLSRDGWWLWGAALIGAYSLFRAEDLGYASQPLTLVLINFLVWAAIFGTIHLVVRTAIRFLRR